MSTINSAIDAPKSLPSFNVESSDWDFRTVFLAVGAGTACYFLFRSLIGGEATPRQRPIAKRHIATLFPTESVNGKHDLIFGNKVASGVFRVHAEKILPPNHNLNAEVLIECSYRNQPFFTQRMTPGDFLEAYVPEIPLNKPMTVRIIHQDFILATVELQAERAMGIYNLFLSNSEWQIKSHHYALPKLLTLLSHRDQQDPDSPTKIKLSADRPVRFKKNSESTVSIVNQCNLIHILFFQVLGTHSDLPAGEVYVLPVVIFPDTTKALPPDFFRKNWEITYQTVRMCKPPSNATLQLLSVRDTVSELDPRFYFNI